jgi:hypothetical protein
LGKIFLANCWVFCPQKKKFPPPPPPPRHTYNSMDYPSCMEGTMNGIAVLRFGLHCRGELCSPVLWIAKRRIDVVGANCVRPFCGLRLRGSANACPVCGLRSVVIPLHCRLWRPQKEVSRRQSRRGGFHSPKADEIWGGVPYCRFTNPRQTSADTPFEQTPADFVGTPFGKGAVGAYGNGASQSAMRANKVRPYGDILRASEALPRRMRGSRSENHPVKPPLAVCHPSTGGEMLRILESRNGNGASQSAMRASGGARPYEDVAGAGQKVMGGDDGGGDTIISVGVGWFRFGGEGGGGELG